MFSIFINNGFLLFFYLIVLLFYLKSLHKTIPKFAEKYEGELWSKVWRFSETIGTTLGDTEAVASSARR